MPNPSNNPILKKSDTSESVYPEFFKISDSTQKEKFSILKLDPRIYIYDTIQDQVKELIKIRHPNKKLTDKEISEKSLQEFNGQTLEEYGTWIFYPWSRRLVHLLDEKEFIELRTNRNLYKITAEERDILAKKKVGIIGLSVGQSVSLTMAIERSFGEIRIADFDILELSNLNRIRAGIHNLGISKVKITAREIAEIDPYLKVVCYEDGITEDNIDSFLFDGGRLDVLIDECDSFDIKVLCREKAKKAMIPVLMEASDRGTIDIERYDLEPERELFHGNLKGIDYLAMKSMEREERLTIIYKITGTTTLSPRMKLSLPEIGKSISAWPQLSSGVVLGGGISADIYRRICLNQLSISGRFFIDLETLISDDQEESINNKTSIV